jgi:hypothetical protein
MDNPILRYFVSLTVFYPHARPWGQPQQNWIKTLPNKGWFAYFRFYGPTQPYFDRTWALPDIVEVK